MYNDFDPRTWMQPVDDIRPIVVWVVVLGGLLALRWLVPAGHDTLGIVQTDWWFAIAGVSGLAAAGLTEAVLALWARFGP